MSSSVVYVLECASQGDGPSFYVGHTDSLARRIAQHFLGTGSQWTKKYKPQRVLSVQEGGKALETAITVQLMCEKGYKNVRGGGWCKMEITEPSFFQEARNWERYASSRQDTKREGCPKDLEIPPQPLLIRSRDTSEENISTLKNGSDERTSNGSGN